MFIDEKIKDFLKQEQDITKRIKNLVISCVEENFISSEKLKVNKEYHVWSLYPGCTLTFKGLDEILKIEKDITNYDDQEIIDYDIYGKSGIIVRSGITEIILKDELLNKFNSKNFKSTVAQEVIEYLYSGKSVWVYDHISWKEAKEDK